MGRDIIKRIVARYSRGDSKLMRGLYSTKEDIDKRREAVLKYNFGIKNKSNVCALSKTHCPKSERYLLWIRKLGF
jgi:hypothetical protein